MNKNAVKLTACFMTLLFAFTLLPGCKKQEEITRKDANTVSNQQSAAEKITLPLANPITLKIWQPMPSNIATYAKTLNDIEYYKELEKRTNIKLKFTHPPIGQEKETFNLMIASRDLPDIIESGLGNYSGGAVKARADDIIISLNDLIRDYAPNLSKLIAEKPEIPKEVKSPDGQYLFFPYIRNDVESLVTTGPIMRKDWLDDLGIKAPATVDEWTAVLKAFKEKKKAKSPFTMGMNTNNIRGGNILIGAYGIGYGYFVDNGKVKFGNMEPAYKDLLTLMRGWYKDGLLDQEFAMNNAKTFDAKVLNGEAGAFIAANGGLERYYTQGKAKEPKYDLAGIEYPTLKAGDKNRFLFRTDPISPGTQAAITTANKYPKETTALYDYGYGKEGSILNSYGIENVSYKMENGVPKLTEVITNNPEGLSVTNALLMYCKGNNGGAFMLDANFFKEYWRLPQQQTANKAWAKWVNEYTANPPNVKGILTAEEANSIASKETEINTFTDEMFVKFVMGVEPLENFDKYVDQLKRMGVEDVIKMKQVQQDRYAGIK